MIEHFHYDIICAPIFSLMPRIAHNTTKIRGNVMSVRMPNGRILLVTNCNHHLASIDQSVLVMPSVITQ